MAVKTQFILAVYLLLMLNNLHLCLAEQYKSEDKSWFQLGCPRLGLGALDKETVPIPWEAVSYLKPLQTVKVWNRQYCFAGDMFLSAINCGEVNLFAAPAELNIKVKGTNGRLVFTEPEIIEGKTGKGRLVLRRTGSFLSVAAELIYTIEYDGLIWCELKLLSSDESRHIEQLQLVITLKKDTAVLTHYVGAPTTYTSQNLPDESYSKALSSSSGNCYKSGLKTMLWVGNTTHGLLWCIESDQNWWPKGRKDCLRLDRQADGTLCFVVDMVNSTLPASTPNKIVYAFGLMATPVKLMPDGWRAWTQSTQWDSCVGNKRGINLFYWPDEYRFMYLDQDPSRYINLDYERKKVTKDVNEGRFIIPYWSLLNFYTRSIESDSKNKNRTVVKVNPDGERMMQEWSVTPNNPSKKATSSYYRLSANMGWSDYLVWCVEGFAQKMGHADGIYLDEVQPVPNTRAESLGGYDDFDGVRRPTFEFFGTRNFLKRVAYNTYNRNKQRPRIIAHCSATHTLNSLSACDMFLIGEQYNINYLKGYPDLKPPCNKPEEQLYYYSYALPMDRVRTECFGRQWGEVMVWLPQFKGQSQDIMDNHISTRDMLSRVMQGDMLIWPLWCNGDEVHKTWKFRQEFDVGNNNVEFVPYWENNVIIVKTVNGSDKIGEVVIGYYRNSAKDTYLAIVSNLNRYPCKVEVDLRAMSVRSIKDAETQKNIVMNNSGKILLNLKRNDYKALRINY